MIPEFRKCAMLALCISASAASVSHAAPAIVGIEAYPIPQKVYAGQDFELRFDIIVTQPCDLNIERPAGIPDYLRLGTPRALGGPARADDGNFLVRIAMPARASEPMPPLSGTSRIGIDIVTRRQTFFGSAEQHLKSYVPLAWGHFEVLPLPDEGRPDDFSGAVGVFSLSSSVEPDRLNVGDIAKWTIRLTGRGNAGEVRLSAPPLDSSLFKVYPSAGGPNAGEGTLASLECAIVPLSTQAVETAAVRLTYFDPVSGSYETAVAPPVRIEVGKRVPAAGGTTKTISILSDGTEVATNVEGRVQLMLAPSARSLSTHMVSPQDLETVECTPDGQWRRVVDRHSGHSGWLRK